MDIVSPDDLRVVALSAALAPYAWSQATPEMLARRLVGVLDRQWLLGELPGPRPSVRLGDVVPADPGDERVELLVAMLRTLRWRVLTRTALCRQLVSALESWSVRRQLAELELGWMLDGG